MAMHKYPCLLVRDGYDGWVVLLCFSKKKGERLFCCGSSVTPELAVERAEEVAKLLNKRDVPVRLQEGK